MGLYNSLGSLRPMRSYAPYNGMSLDVPQLVRFDDSGLMPDQLYNSAGRTTRTVGGKLHG